MEKKLERLMIGTIKLRHKPELKFILNEKEFEIVDVYEQENSGIYSFVELKNAELNAERTNWLITFLSIIVGFFIGGGTSKRFKEKANLNIEIENRNLKIWLINADFEAAKLVTKFLHNKIKINK